MVICNCHLCWVAFNLFLVDSLQAAEELEDSTAPELSDDEVDAAAPRHKRARQLTDYCYSTSTYILTQRFQTSLTKSTSQIDLFAKYWRRSNMTFVAVFESPC